MYNRHQIKQEIDYLTHNIVYTLYRISGISHRKLPEKRKMMMKKPVMLEVLVMMNLMLTLVSMNLFFS